MILYFDLELVFFLCIYIRRVEVLEKKRKMIFFTVKKKHYIHIVRHIEFFYM